MDSALLLYWSAGGNTGQVADALDATLEGHDIEVDEHEISEELKANYLDYTLVLVGAPVYQFLPPRDVRKFLVSQQNRHDVRPSAPLKKGHHGVVFCTYGGPHTGYREAEPALKYMGQFLEHAGIPVRDELAVVGEFHAPKRQHMNVKGRLGDIRGRPSEEDLAQVRNRMQGILRHLDLGDTSAGD